MPRRTLERQRSERKVTKDNVNRSIIVPYQMIDRYIYIYIYNYNTSVSNLRQERHRCLTPRRG